MDNINKLETEKQNESSLEIDTFDSLKICQTINNEDKKVAYAIEEELDNIAKIIDVAADRVDKGGRIIYMGAGCSGRLGYIDAAELPPTYGVDYETVQGTVAGGLEALVKAKEGVEDDENAAIEDLKAKNLSDKDILITVAASGRTPYVLSGLRYAKSIGCATAALACVKNSESGKIADIKVETVTGQEVIAGSTRMKAGTSTKMILNMISTGVFVKLGKVYNNLMVDMMPVNLKLVERSKNIICKACNVEYDEACELYEKADHNIKVAICMKETGLDSKESLKLIEDYKGHLKEAIKSFKNK